MKKHLSKYNPNNPKNTLPSNLFEPYKKEICDLLRGRIFDKFIESEKYTRFLSMEKFRIKYSGRIHWGNFVICHLTMFDLF